MNDITELTRTRYPIIMGALGALAGPELIAAVSDAGGLGLIATIGMDSHALKDTIQKIRELTDQPIGANLMAINPDSPRLAEVLANEHIEVVTTSAGSPRALTDILHDFGLKVLHVVPSPELALKAEAAGVDGMVAEGGESGGMQAPKAISTMCLVPEVVEAVTVPVVAAGGIFDAHGYAAAFALGAMGVQLGTALILTDECRAHPDYKKSLIDTGPQDTAVVPMNVGPLRVLENDIIRRTMELDPERRKQAVTDAWARFNETCTQPDTGDNLVMTGQCAGAINGLIPARELVQRMAHEGAEILRSLGDWAG